MPKSSPSRRAAAPAPATGTAPAEPAEPDRPRRPAGKAAKPAANPAGKAAKPGKAAKAAATAPPAPQAADPGTPDAEADPADGATAPEFLNRAQRRAQGRKGSPPVAGRNVVPGRRSDVPSPRQWTRRRGGG